MPQLDLDGANSKISADTIRGQSGTTVTVQSGHNLAGSGSGLTALPAANLTGTLPAISGASLTNLPNNSPAFEVYMSSNMTSLATTNTKIEFNTEAFDTDSAWDTTNYRFTVPSGENGKYVIFVNVYVSGSGGDIGDYNLLRIHKNGSEFCYNYNHIGNHSSCNNLIRILPLVATDYIEFYTSFEGGTHTLYTTNSLLRTVAYGYKLIGI